MCQYSVKTRRLERPLLVSSTVHSFSSSASSSAECVLQREEQGADEEEEAGGGRTRGVPSARGADGPGDELGSPVHLQQVRAAGSLRRRDNNRVGKSAGVSSCLFTAGEQNKQDVMQKASTRMPDRKKEKEKN